MARYSGAITLAAGEGRAFPAPFAPDFWQVYAPNPITGPVNVYPYATKSGQAWPITGTGQVSFPGEENQDSIWIENTGVTTATLNVYCSKGVTPATYAGPISTAKPLSALLQSQMKIEAVNLGAQLITTYHHVGRFAYLLLEGYHNTAAGQWQVTSCTLGGVPGVLLERSQLQGTNSNSIDGTVWQFDQSANGDLQLVINVTSGMKALYGLMLSYTDGIRAGNVNGVASQTTPQAFTLLGQVDASVMFAIALDNTASLSETGGAIVFDPVHGVPYANCDAGAWQRLGKGTNLFAWSFAGTEPFGAVGLEILPA